MEQNKTAKSWVRVVVDSFDLIDKLGEKDWARKSNTKYLFNINTQHSECTQTISNVWVVKQREVVEWNEVFFSSFMGTLYIRI